jgi:Holliday junction resolvase
MSVNQNAARAGRYYETEIMQYLREKGYDVEKLRLTGTEDEGDLLLRTGNRFVIEAKRTKSLDLAGWVKEAQVERLNYMRHRNISELNAPGFVVIHKARGKGIGGSYVTTTLDEWADLL